MEATFESLTAAIARDGLRKYARWDTELFAEVTCDAGRAVWHTVQDGPQAEPVFHAYLRLVQEALGAGYLRRPAAGNGSGWPNFLSFCLLDLVPRALPRVPEAERLPRLAQIWNFGEGLLRQPAWIDRYVTVFAGGLIDLNQVEDFLVRTLETVLAPVKPARWDGPFTVTILDTRQLDDDFLPGDMHLAAPAVVCIHDRCRADVHLAVFLQHERRSRFLGLSPCLGQYPAAEALPKVQVAEHQLQVGDHVVKMPFVGYCRQHVLAGPGFAVASAVDSQCLWVLESP